MLSTIYLVLNIKPIRLPLRRVDGSSFQVFIFNIILANLESSEAVALEQQNAAVASKVLFYLSTLLLLQLLLLMYCIFKFLVFDFKDFLCCTMV